MSASGAHRAIPQNGRPGFPWMSNGINFTSRGHFERTVEQFVTAGTKQHLAAARTLVSEAAAQCKLTTDQYNDLKERLQL